MKHLKTVIIPVAAGILLAAIVIACFLLFVSGEATPEAAVCGYLKACMLQDVDGMIKLSSDYAKATLNGGELPSDSDLKSKLSKIYDEEDSVYKGSKITFAITSNTALDLSGSDAVDFIATYSSRADISAVTELRLVSVTVYVDGNLQQKGNCYAVKVGSRWYFAYQY